MPRSSRKWQPIAASQDVLAKYALPVPQIIIKIKELTSQRGDTKSANGYRPEKENYICPNHGFISSKERKRLAWERNRA